MPIIGILRVLKGLEVVFDAQDLLRLLGLQKHLLSDLVLGQREIVVVKVLLWDFGVILIFLKARSIHYLGKRTLSYSVFYLTTRFLVVILALRSKFL